jgi:tetratricopeptide (TPR) repeat protein
MALTINDFLKKYTLADSKIPSHDNDTIQIITQIINGNIDDHIDSTNGIALLYIGFYYFYVKKDINSAEKYYLAAREYNNFDAPKYLGDLYLQLYMQQDIHVFQGNKLKQGKLDFAKLYYHVATEHNNIDAMIALGNLYFLCDELDLAETYYLMAINGPDISENLGKLYEKQCKFDLAMKYYIKAYMSNAITMCKISEIIPKVSYKMQLEVLESIPIVRNNSTYFHMISHTTHIMFMNKKIKMCQYLSYYLIREVVDICLNFY